MVIPDVILLDTCNKILNIIRDDYNDNILSGTESRSLLYILFNGLQLGRFDLYENVKASIITTPEHPKHIDAVTLSFNKDLVKSPFIYLSLPAESVGGNSLGIGEGDYDEAVYNNNYPSQDAYRKQYNRRYRATYYLMIGSENSNETIILYHLFKSMLVTCTNHLALSGIENLSIGGQDLRLNTSIPDTMFVRAITMSFEYEQQVPELSVRSIYDRILIYWKPEGADVRQGPILVDSDDSDSDSFT